MVVADGVVLIVVDVLVVVVVVVVNDASATTFAAATASRRPIASALRFVPSCTLLLGLFSCFCVMVWFYNRGWVLAVVHDV